MRSFEVVQVLLPSRHHVLQLLAQPVGQTVERHGRSVSRLAESNGMRPILGERAGVECTTESVWRWRRGVSGSRARQEEWRAVHCDSTRVEGRVNWAREKTKQNNDKKKTVTGCTWMADKESDKSIQSSEPVSE